jgi:hypothetical protein
LKTILLDSPPPFLSNCRHHLMTRQHRLKGKTLSRHEIPKEGKFTVYQSDDRTDDWVAKGPGFEYRWSPGEPYEDNRDVAMLTANRAGIDCGLGKVESIDYDLTGGRFRFKRS